MATPMIKVVEGLNQPTVRRKLRSPKHPFSVRAKPFEICPFLIAPVLPGETMTNALLQSRVVSDPIAHPLIGFASALLTSDYAIEELDYDQAG